MGEPSEGVALREALARTLMQHRIYDSPVTNWWRCGGCQRDVGTRQEAEQHQTDALLDALSQDGASVSDPSESPTPIAWAFIAHGGQLNYACLRHDERHYATSTHLLNDCLWHGAECDDWTVLVPPFALTSLPGSQEADRG